MTPTWILDILAALMLVVAAVSAARLGLARPWRKGAVVTDADVSHVFMGIAMAGMLASGLTTLPDRAWEVIFALLAVWFGYRVVSDARSNGARALAGGHCAPHLVHSAAMLYMFLALAARGPGASGMSGMGAGSAVQALKYPTLAFVFALILIGYSAWDLDQLSGKRYSRAGTSLSPARVRAPTVPALAGAEPGALVSGALVSGAVMSGDAVVSGDSPQVAWSRAAAVETTGAKSAPAEVAGRLLSTGTTVGCRIAMGATMAFMLLIMI
jgi:hypothetical protein